MICCAVCLEAGETTEQLLTLTLQRQTPAFRLKYFTSFHIFDSRVNLKEEFSSKTD